MIPLPLAAISATPAIATAIAADNGAKRAETGDDFAALLGAQIAVAAGETKPEAASVHAPLPNGGKTLPDVAAAEPEAAEPGTTELSATDDALPPPQPEVSALPTVAFALAAAATIAPVVAEAVTDTARPITANPTMSPSTLALDDAKPANLPTVRPEDKTRVPQTPSGQPEIPPKPNDDTADKPAPGRPNAAPQVSLPAQAASRAVLIHGVDPALTVDPIKPAPVLPEQAAAQATIALAARGNPERPARLPEAVAAVASPSDAEPVSELQLALPRPLKFSLADHAPSVDVPPALVAPPADGDVQAVAPAPTATPTLARHDFAAMIDRLFEARDMVGAQPVAMTLRHDDFGAVSLNFRNADDGLTVTMASPDPDFARAVNAAAASGAASNQSDPGRQGGDGAPSRQHGGNAADEDLSGQSRAGSRSSERDTSRPRGAPSQAQPSTPRQHGRNGIFA